jgi:hypothetical protein
MALGTGPYLTCDSLCILRMTCIQTASLEVHHRRVKMTNYIRLHEIALSNNSAQGYLIFITYFPWRNSARLPVCSTIYGIMRGEHDDIYYIYNYIYILLLIWGKPMDQWLTHETIYQSGNNFFRSKSGLRR